MIPADRRKTITEIFKKSDTPQALKADLEQQDYILAKGGKRAYEVIDQYGEIHSLVRQIEGRKTKDIKARLSGMGELPTAEQARTHLKDKAQKEQITAKFNKLIEKDREALKQRRDTRRMKLLSERQRLELMHRQERLALHAAQKSETGILFNRVASKVFALIFRMPALRSVIAYLHINPLVSSAERHRLENDVLLQRHASEKQDIERKWEALDLVEKKR